MADLKVEIWATGKLQNGFTTDQVAEKTGSMFPSATPVQRARFISGLPFRITTADTADAASRIAKVLEASGLVVEIRRAATTQPPPQESTHQSTLQAEVRGPRASAPLAPLESDSPTSSSSKRAESVEPTEAELLKKYRFVTPVLWVVVAIGALVGTQGNYLKALPMLLVAVFLYPKLKYRTPRVALLSIAVCSIVIGGQLMPFTENADRYSSGISEECLADLQCAGERQSAPRIECAVAVDNLAERLAKHDYKWTDGVTEKKFEKIQWKNKDARIATFLGNKMKLQNGFGVWSTHGYACDYDFRQKKVIGAIFLN